MRSRLTPVCLVILAGGVLALTSCSSKVRVAKRHPSHSHPQVAVVKKGPPPHAPAHGYRHKHSGAVLVYKSNLGMYQVDGRAGHYFYKDQFYRLHDGQWQVSVHFQGPWNMIPDSKLPKKLHKHKHAKAHGKKKHKK